MDPSGPYGVIGSATANCTDHLLAEQRWERGCRAGIFSLLCVGLKIITEGNGKTEIWGDRERDGGHRWGGEQMIPTSHCPALAAGPKERSP